MKNAKVLKAYKAVLQTIDASTLVNACFGSCNITAEFLNDYGIDGTQSFIAEFLNDYGIDGTQSFIAEFLNENLNVNHIGDITVDDILENPDCIVSTAANEFYSAVSYIFNGNDVDHIVRDAYYKFDYWGNFYIFANPWSNACADYFIIRADSEHSAYEILTAEFEHRFAIDENYVDEDTQYNDNGTPINTDNLQFVGVIEL